MKQPQIAVILSGCGHRDGAEIHEATLSLWAIHKLGGDYICFAPNKVQHHVLNHLNGEEMDEKRNVLIESARIARGNIKDLSSFSSKEFDGLVIPGGLGAVKNLSDYGMAGSECRIDPQVSDVVLTMHRANKPIGLLCIAPVLAAKLIPGVTLTVGQAPAAAENLVAMGATVQPTDHGQIVLDRHHKVVSTPCYMLDSRVDQIADGALKLVEALFEMIRA